MNHLLAAYLFITLSVGVASLLVLILVNRQLKNRSLVYYTMICGCLGVSVLSNLLLFYFGINVSGELSLTAIILILSSLPTSFLMQGLIPVLVHRIYQVPWEKWGNRTVIFLMTLQTILVFTPWFLSYSLETKRISFHPGFMVVNFVLLFFFAYIIVIAFIFRKNLSGEIRPIVRRTLILFLVFIPGLIHDQTYFANQASLDKIPVTVIFFPLFFLGLALGNIFYGMKFLTVKTPQGDSTTPPLPQAPGISDSKALEILTKEFIISDREREVAHLILEGHGNKQIAAVLQISTKTVNNHIYNLFQKLGINSRFELMAKINQISGVKQED